MKYSGLTAQQAQEKILKFGPNVIRDVKKASPFKILLRQFQGNYVLYLLGVAAAISFFVDERLTSYTIFGVIVTVVGAGFFQEYKAEKAVDALKDMLNPISMVYRDGILTELDSAKIVPEDIVVLRLGEKVPADAVILEEKNLNISEAVLTGESKSVRKKIGDPVMMGTYLVEGRCVIKVEKTGMSTKFGEIAKLISTADKKLPLQEKINRITTTMVIAASIIAILIGFLSIYRAETYSYALFVETLILVIALAVSAFPEGFPVVLTTTLAVGALRMSKKNAIVNRMSTIETLGEISVICSDKTGTITTGEMTAKFALTAHGLYEISGVGYEGNGDFSINAKLADLNTHKDLEKLIKAAVLCNDTTISRTGNDNDFKVSGSPTEGALLVMAAKAQIFSDTFDVERIEEEPFSSEKKMMSVLVREKADFNVYAKGAPEKILELCTHAYDGTALVELNRTYLNNFIVEMANKSFRTLAIAYKNLPSENRSYDENDLVLLGIVALQDPPREGVTEAVAIAKHAGIRTVMITGDIKETALAVATQVGITGDVLEGFEIEAMSDEELREKVKTAGIYARVQPAHKIRIVRALKENKEIVAMTGDGVNDSPALREAHVGIAMGKNGTDVSREAADLILKDDNFSTIVEAIGEGRTVFSNIRKFITYQLGCNYAELLAIFINVLLAPVFKWHVPMLTAIQILFMNLTTDNIPAITLGFNPTSKDIMNESPRTNSYIINKTLIAIIAITGVLMAFFTLLGYYIVHIVFGFSSEFGRSTALLTLILLQIGGAFAFRSFRKLVLTRSILVNKWLVWASILSLFLTLIIMYTPLSVIFETQSLGLVEWGTAIVLTFVYIAILDGLKFFAVKSKVYTFDTK